MPAKSMHSYADTLYDILNSFNPETVFEWGPGTSTQIMALHPSVKKIDSVEHSPYFYEKMKGLNLPNLEVHYAYDMEEYVMKIGGASYDLIFIDGRNRVKCLLESRGRAKLVILHDAARKDYRQAIYEYNYRVWTDDGQTVVMTNDESIFRKVSEALKNLLCDEPAEEIVVVSGGEV